MPRRSLSHIATLHFVAILLVILNLSNIQIAGFSGLMPLFDLMIVFYFAVFRPNFSIWFIFLLGCWHDALAGSPLGTTSLCYILLVKLFLLLNGKMFIRENFPQLLKQFALFCFLFLLMKWAILSIFSGAAISLISPLIQLVLTPLSYILMHKFFDFLSLKLLEE